MSHFLVGVIVPGDTPKEAMQRIVDGLMAPYDENVRVDEYEEDCHCVGHEAVMEALDFANTTIGHARDLRDNFGKEVREPYLEKLRTEGKSKEEIEDEIWDDDGYLQKEFDKWMEPWETAKETHLANNPKKDQPDPTCGFYSGEREDWWPKNVKEGDRYEDGSGCAGTGKVMTTYNPKSKWDWWSFGGRWNGSITGNYKGDDKGFNFGDEYRQLDPNIAKVSDLLAHELIIEATEDPAEKKKLMRESRLPFAIITPDGVWNEKGKMGWWASVSDKKENWREIALEILKQNENNLILGLDCHI